jgi:chromosome segregation ATPase
MIEIIESERLIELVIDKHNRFLETFNSEFTELDTRLSDIKQQSDANKKEMERTESRIAVLNEKYHLIFHQSKKQREDIFALVLDKMRAAKASNIQTTIRLGSRIEEFEKKLQNSKNIEDEERTIVGIKKLLYDFESAARTAGIIITCKAIADKLNEANSSHKELISLQDKPEMDTGSYRDIEKQIGEIEEQHGWLKRRIESHNNALTYWKKQKGVMKFD